MAFVQQAPGPEQSLKDWSSHADQLLTITRHSACGIPSSARGTVEKGGTAMSVSPKRLRLQRFSCLWPGKEGAF